VPELPDVELYLHALRPRIVGQRLEHVRIGSPFLLRTVDPPVSEIEGRDVVAVSRLGKRIVLRMEDELYLVIHLMIAGRFRWKPPGTAIPGKVGLAAFDFPTGTLILTEASKKKRAQLHLVRGREALRAFDRDGAAVGSFPSAPGAPYLEGADWAAILRQDYLRRPDSLIVDGIV